MAEPTTDNLKRTPLHDLHEELGAKLVPFAGYEMPVQYPMGVKDEHLWTRSEAGLFDVSHMGPCFLSLADGIGGATLHSWSEIVWQDKKGRQIKSHGKSEDNIASMGVP